MRGEIEDVMLEKRYEGKLKVCVCLGGGNVMRGEIQGVMGIKAL